MKAIVCEMCGSQDLIKREGMYVCESCGTKYSTEEAKKLMVEIENPVTIDNSEKVNNLYQLARRARDANNVEDAEKYYGLVLQECPKDWEAQFFAVYFKAAHTNLLKLNMNTQNLKNCISPLLSNALFLPDTEKEILIDTIGTYTNSLCRDLRDFVFKHANGFESSSDVWSDALDYFSSIETLARECGSKLYIMKNNDVAAKYCVEAYKIATTCIADMHTCLKKMALAKCNGSLNNTARNLILDNRQEAIKAMESNAKIIRDFEPNYSIPLIPEPPQASGCYVATSVYGSYNCPQVWTLRRFRDNTLSSSWYGRAFIHAYYAISPTLVKWFGNTIWFKNMWKPILDKMVSSLNNKGVESTPYIDKQW